MKSICKEALISKKQVWLKLFKYYEKWPLLEVTYDQTIFQNFYSHQIPIRSNIAQINVRSLLFCHYAYFWIPKLRFKSQTISDKTILCRGGSERGVLRYQKYAQVV